jgi:hypothetical protein
MIDVRILRASAVVSTVLLLIGPNNLHASNESAKAWESCQSGNADERLGGCTLIIDSKGFGSSSRLADALDARCWALHVKGQFAAAIDDCQASIRIRPKYSYAYNNLGASDA